MAKRISRRTALVGAAGGIVVGAGIAATGGKGRSQALDASDQAKHSNLVVDLASFGVSPEATPQENLARFKRAVANTPLGATLRLPPTGLQACTIDTSGGWSDAVWIDKPLVLQIEGNLKATHSAVRHNPPFIINVTAPGVLISGTGRIIGSGWIDDTNAGTDEVFPGLIRVAADDFTMTGVEVVAPPKVGLMLYQCHGARIRGVRFTGGPTVYGDTSHFAIRAAGGGRHVFDGNRFYPAADGGMAVQCIMLAGSHGNLFTRNHALHPYEKLIYAYGDRNIARDNTVIGNPGFIPGTNIQGTITAVIRFHGSFNRVESNHTRDCAGGVQMMDGSAHMVIGNQFLSCGQSAISAYRSDLSESIFASNVGTRGSLAGFVAGDGMRLISDKGRANNVLVELNQISGFSVADAIATIAAWKGGKAFGRNSVVKPTRANGRYYSARVVGVTAPQEPKWPESPGDAVVDGTVTWVCVAYEGGQAEITLNGMNAGAPITASAILNNQTSGGRYGIVTQFLTHSRIAGNRLQASEWGLVENAGRHNRWQYNDVSGTPHTGVRDLDTSSIILR